jgi:hypothetical protein
VSEMQIQGLALVILLVPLFLISAGATAGVAILWWLGLALLAAGGLIPAALRYVPVNGKEESEE